MDIQPLVCLTPLPFCSCFSLHRCGDCSHISPCHLCIFKACHVVVSRKCPREHLISLLKLHFLKYTIYPIIYPFQFDLNPNFLSFSSLLIDSDQHFVSRSTTELLRSCLNGCKAVRYYPVVKTVFLRRTITRGVLAHLKEKQKKCSANRHS